MCFCFIPIHAMNPDIALKRLESKVTATCLHPLTCPHNEAQDRHAWSIQGIYITLHTFFSAQLQKESEVLECALAELLREILEEPREAASPMSSTIPKPSLFKNARMGSWSNHANGLTLDVGHVAAVVEGDLGRLVGTVAVPLKACRGLRLASYKKRLSQPKRKKGIMSRVFICALQKSLGELERSHQPAP